MRAELKRLEAEREDFEDELKLAAKTQAEGGEIDGLTALLLKARADNEDGAESPRLPPPAATIASPNSEVNSQNDEPAPPSPLPEWAAVWLLARVVRLTRGRRSGSPGKA